jgi:hypothetical protein
VCVVYNKKSYLESPCAMGLCTPPLEYWIPIHPPSTHHTSTIQKLNHKSVTQPTVELKSIANTILNELQGEVEDDAHQTTFNTQLAQISLIRTRQLNDYLKVCVLRLQHEDPHNTSEKITHRVQDHVSILKAILST